MLRGNKILLRYPEPADAPLLHRWENDPDIRKAGNGLTRYSRKEIEKFIVESLNDVYTEKQLRLMICACAPSPRKKPAGSTVGCIDLFDFDEYHRRAGVGILIADKKYRQNGYASESLALLIRHAFENLSLRQLYCTVAENNPASMKLFLRHRFQVTGRKKGWIRDGRKFVDEYILQLFNEES